MADVELLPLPEGAQIYGRDEMHAYARANLAPLQAKNEALRAEVERLNTELPRLEAIAGYGGVSSDAPERLILASEVYDGIQSCDKWCDVRRVVEDGQPMPESATAYVRADRAELLDSQGKAAPARYFAGGPKHHFYTDDLEFARYVVNLIDKDDDWTITDLQEPRAHE